MISREGVSGGRFNVRRMLATGAVILGGLTCVDVVAAADPESRPAVTVREERGVYSVTARFNVPHAPSVVMMVLTDYEQIPRFMPQIKTSVVLERTAGRALVRQEAVSRVMLFSKRVHLVLDISEETDVLRFSDRCGVSFVRYEGMWRLSEESGSTEILYELTAQPSFDVPEFLLKRLLRHESMQTLDQLRREIAVRSAR